MEENVFYTVASAYKYDQLDIVSELFEPQEHDDCYFCKKPNGKLYRI